MTQMEREMLEQLPVTYMDIGNTSYAGAIRGEKKRSTSLLIFFKSIRD